MAHYSQTEFLRQVRAHLPERFRSARVLEVGSWDINGSARPLFEASEYVGTDLAAGPGVDLVCAGESLAFADAHFDMAISCECFEHNPRWRQTLANMYRMLKPGGLIVVTCATTGRAEHGTQRLARWASVATAPTSADYYRNITARELRSAMRAAGQCAFVAVTTNIYASDVYLLAVRGGASVDAADPARLAQVMDAARRIRLEYPLRPEDRMRLQARWLVHRVAARALGERVYHTLRYRLFRHRQSRRLLGSDA